MYVCAHEKEQCDEVLRLDTCSIIIPVMWLDAGFKYASKGCCGAGRYNGQFLCFPFVKPCPNRKDYIWWDAFHPTEATNELLGRFLYDTTSPLLN
jgi:phospholipase/lecithinase/hemolysin